MDACNREMIYQLLRDLDQRYSLGLKKKIMDLRMDDVSRLYLKLERRLWEWEEKIRNEKDPVRAQRHKEHYKEDRILFDKMSRFCHHIPKFGITNREYIERLYMESQVVDEFIKLLFKSWTFAELLNKKESE